MKKTIYFYKRFKEKTQKNLGNNNSIKSIIIFLDYLLSFIIYGTSIADYFQYEFYKKRHSERKTFVTWRKHKKIQKMSNDSKDSKIIINKEKFNKVFDQFIKRDWIYINDCGYTEFEKFIKKHNEVFVKPSGGSCGQNVYIYKYTQNENLLNLFERLKLEKAIIEEKIIQTGELKEFNPDSVNTIRITTLKRNDDVYIMSSALRLGNGKVVNDNVSTGGLVANIDKEYGVIDSYGVDKDSNKFLIHPHTQKQIIGYKIPYWEQVKSYAKQIANMVPNVRYVGWDIVLKENGELLLIEGNNDGGHRVQQISSQKGLWLEYKKLLKEKKERK